MILLGTILSNLGLCVSTCIDWFSDLTYGSGTFALVLFVLFISIIYKYLLSPIFGSTGSDLVRNSYRGAQAELRRQESAAARERAYEKYYKYKYYSKKR